MRAHLIIEEKKENGGLKIRRVDCKKVSADYICSSVGRGEWPQGFDGSESRRGFNSLPAEFFTLYPSPKNLSAFVKGGFYKG